VGSPAALPETAQAVRALSLNVRLRRTYRLIDAHLAGAVDHGTVNYSHDREGQLIGAVTEMDFSRARRLLRMIAEDNGGSGEDLLDALRTTATRIWALSDMPGGAPACPPSGGGMLTPVSRVVEWFDAIMTAIAEREGEDRLTHKGEFLRFVEEHYQENVGLAEMAEALNMSIGYASGLFRELVGVNFKDYLRAWRIREAKRILESGEVLVKDLARRVGYLNTQTFIRAFMREAGLPPGQYMRSVSRGDARQGTPV
jgi:AraC-like DNA-binding protein